MSKNIFRSKLTLEEIAFAEANHYYIQVGEDTVEYQGRQTFSKDRAEYLFFELLESMKHMAKKGNKQEKQTAIFGLLNFRICPVRLH